MNGFAEVFAGIARRAAQASPEEPGDYLGDDGLLYCGKCHTQKQCRVNIFDHDDIVSCLCKCATERMDAEDRAMKRREEMDRIQSFRVQGIQDKAIREYTFAKAEQTDEIIKCQKYVGHWTEVLANNSGLLFWGGVGNGKTFAASCIANALIDRGIPALVTSFPRILNAGWDKAEIISQMQRFPLIVIDDLGAERQSDYALETVYAVVDERYKARKPLIVTTNLTMDEMNAPKSMNYRRIYSRISEICVPVYFKGGSRRDGIAQSKKDVVREIFG